MKAQVGGCGRGEACGPQSVR